MQTIFRQVMAAALVATAGAAHAQRADTGWYFGIGAGGANYSDDIPHQIATAYAGNGTFEFLSATTTGGADTATQAFMGYRFLPWLAAEVGYQRFGSARTFYSLNSYQPVLDAVPLLLRGTYRVRDFNAALVATWPVGGNFALLARGGVADTSLDYDEHGNDAGGNPYAFHARTYTHANAQAGIGALWQVARHFALRLDLDRTFDVGRKFALHPDTNGRFDHIDAYTLNLVWNP